MSNLIERHHTNARMSKIVLHGGLIYLCGQTSSGSEIIDVEGQACEVLRRIDALLIEVGSDRSRLISAVIHLKDIGDFAAMNSAWEAWMPSGASPARTTVEARLASPDLKVEITVIAAA